MRGMTWDPRHGFRCEDCGGFEADLLADGSARCQSCGRVSVPRVPRPTAGLGRVFLFVLALFVVAFAVELVLSWIVAAGSTRVFRELFAGLAFITGILAVMFGGIGAAPGHAALGTQRYDRLSRMYMLQNPTQVGALSAKAEARSAEEPGAAGVFLLTGLGLALILAAFVATVA